MRKSILVLAVGALVVTPMASFAQDAGPTQMATGVVYADTDGDGARGEGEPGVADVSVSNGLEVVRTNTEGRYELPVDDETIIFVTKPAGYAVPTDEHQLPQFFYTHYPQGSPVETFYPGIEPTGPLPESVDFALLPAEESDVFDAVVFADPQTRSFNELEDFQTDVVSELVGVDAAFGLTVGDIVNDPLDLFVPHNAIVSTIGLPWWNLPGNHDINFDVPDDEHSTQTFKRVYGPTDYSYDYGRVHFVSMDNVDYDGQDEDGGNGGYRGYLTPEQLEWLSNDLEYVPEDHLVVIATHIPLRTEAIGADNINTVNLDELFAVLEGREHLYSISGHDTSNSWQTYFEPGEELPTPEGVNDAVWDGPHAFHHQVLAEVRGGGWTTGPLEERGVPDDERGVPVTGNRDGGMPQDPPAPGEDDDGMQVPAEGESAWATGLPNGVHAADMADGNPNGYYIIEFDGNTYRPRFKPASLPEDFQHRVTFTGGRGNRLTETGEPVWVPSGPSGSGDFPLAPRFVPEDFASGTEIPQIKVNAFDGGERHVVEVAFDDGGSTAMTYDPPSFGLTDGEEGGNLDPYISALRREFPFSQAPASPQPSAHLWHADIPLDLRPGRHTATVRVTDPWGELSESRVVFETAGDLAAARAGR